MLDGQGSVLIRMFRSPDPGPGYAGSTGQPPQPARSQARVVRNAMAPVGHASAQRWAAWRKPSDNGASNGTARGSRTIRTDTHRLIVHQDAYAELYDHRSPEKETKNIAEGNAVLVSELKGILEARLKQPRGAGAQRP